MNWFIAIVIVLSVIAGLILYGLWFNKRLKTEKTTDKHTIRSEIRNSMKATPIKCFLTSNLMAFYNDFSRALPSNYIIIPNVSAELLFSQGQRNDLRLWGHYSDIVVFTQSYTPVLVVDLIDPAKNNKPLDAELIEIIKSAGIKVLKYPVKSNYNIDDLRKAVAKTMNPLYNQ